MGIGISNGHDFFFISSKNSLKIYHHNHSLLIKSMFTFILR